MYICFDFDVNEPVVLIQMYVYKEMHVKRQISNDTRLLESISSLTSTTHCIVAVKVESIDRETKDILSKSRN